MRNVIDMLEQYEEINKVIIEKGNNHAEIFKKFTYLLSEILIEIN
jgi:hypothetical protein